MPTIASMEVCAVRVPLRRETSFSNRTVRWRDFGLLRVTDDNGERGIGFAYVGTAGGSLLPLAIQAILAPILIGRDSFAVERLWREMYQEALLQGRAGVVMRAISAVDIALWDLNARSAKLPLHKYLGAAERDRVPAYASGGYYLEGKTPEKLGEEMAGYVALGFRAMKMKTGRLSPPEEEARLAAVREAVGPGVAVMMDANNGWGGVAEALPYLRRFEKYEPYFIEEPFLADDIDNHERLARQTSIPIATGEVETGHWRVKTLLDRNCVAVLQTDAAVCGGITEWRRIARMAAGYGVALAPHAFHDLHAPLVAAVPNAAYAEMFLDDEIFNFSSILDRRMKQEGGHLLLHEGSGLGFDFDERALEEFALPVGRRKRWQKVAG